MMFVVRGYQGIDTIAIARARTRARAEEKLDEYRRDLIERSGLVGIGLIGWMFWIEEE
jgi:hypothetical protein